MGCSSSAVAREITGPLGPQFHDLHAVGRTLGSGSFGKVRLVHDKASGDTRAVKIIDVSMRKVDRHNFNLDDNTVDKRRMKQVQKEIDAWKAVGQCSHTVQLYDTFWEGNEVYMVMDWCKCTLAEMIHSRGGIQRSRLPRIMHEMLLGVQCCHDAGVVHRDIKPENFLVTHDGETIKLCDFGFAERLPKSKVLTGIFGTAPFMSPEMLQSVGYGTPTDIWSYGATCYLIAFGEMVYCPEELTSTAMRAAILSDQPRPRYLDADQAAAKSGGRVSEFLRLLLDRQPTARVDAAGTEAALFKEFPLLAVGTAAEELLHRRTSANSGPLPSISSEKSSKPSTSPTASSLGLSPEKAARRTSSASSPTASLGRSPKKAARRTSSTSSPTASLGLSPEKAARTSTNSPTGSLGLSPEKFKPSTTSPTSSPTARAKTTPCPDFSSLVPEKFAQGQVAPQPDETLQDLVQGAESLQKDGMPRWQRPRARGGDYWAALLSKGAQRVSAVPLSRSAWSSDALDPTLMSPRCEVSPKGKQVMYLLSHANA